MKNASFDTYHVRKVCETKLNISFGKGKEGNGYFIYNGSRFARITIPKGRKNIPPKTYKCMALQLKLSVEQFDQLLECPLGLKEYIEIHSQKLSNPPH